jgi:hypothetical protein
LELAGISLARHKAKADASMVAMDGTGATVATVATVTVTVTVAMAMCTVATKEAVADTKTNAWHPVIGGRIAVGRIAVIAGRIPIMGWPPIVTGRRIRVRRCRLIKAIVVRRGVDAAREAGR